MNAFLPEGWLIDRPENQLACKNLSSLSEAYQQSRVLEGRAVLCDHNHNLMVDLGCVTGIIPREEAALGIREGTARDIAIISRVGKPVQFRITGFERDKVGNIKPILSRRSVQAEAMDVMIRSLMPGDILPARITHLESFGAFVDLCCGIVSLLPIDAISVSRISHPHDRFKTGQDINVVISSVDETGRVTLSHKELLGTWEENARRFSCGQTVSGIVRSVEDYGIFIELTPNLAGLAEPRPAVRAGQHASVYIKSLIPEKMKIKLYIVDAFDADYPPAPCSYFIKSGHIDYWKYSPDSCSRIIESRFLGF